MNEVVIQNKSEPLTPGLRLGNSQAAAWASLDMLGAPVPTVLSDGVWSAGHQGAVAPQRLFVLPYCRGAAGSRFSVRIYGWRSVDNNAAANLAGINAMVAIPFLLAELACVACSRQGPQGGDRIVQSSEVMCDTITLARGALGTNGEIVSPGMNLIAFANVELRGARYFSFDFKQTDPVPMNLLFARA